MPGMPKGQREQSLLLVCMVAVAAIGLYWYLVYQPRSVTLAEQQVKVEELVAMNDQAKVEMSRGNLDDIRRDLAKYRHSLSLIRSLVPSGNEVPSLLEQVSTAARRAGLDVATVDPQPVAPGGAYDTYRYGMSIVGGYHQLAEFFTNVGSLTRIMLPVNLSLNVAKSSNAENARQGSGEAVIEARFQLQTFVTHGPDEEDVPPTRGRS